MTHRQLAALLTWVALLTAGLALAQPVAAQEDSGVSLEVSAGFDGVYKERAVVPVWVAASNTGAPLEATIAVTVGDPSFGSAVVYTAPVSLPTGSDKRVPLYVYLPEFGADVAVALLDGEALVAETRTDVLSRLAAGDLLYGVISPEPGALAFLSTIPAGREDAAVAFLGLEDLPDIAPGWQALDLLVLDDTDTSRLSREQRDALLAWIESGGQLVVTGGPGGATTAAGLTEFLPVTVTGSDTVPALPALSAFAGTDLASDGPFVVATSELGNGEAIIIEGDTPLLARRPVGRGAVYFLALDPKLDPLRGWAGATVIWETFAASAPNAPPWGNGLQDSFAAGSAISAIPGLELPSIWQLIAFLLVYTLVVGPINYLILRRMRRPELAWISIPALVVLFSLVTLFTGFRTRGNVALLNEMAVSYGHIDAASLQTQTVTGLYSPRRDTYTLEMPYTTTVFPFSTGFGPLQSGGNLDTIERSAVVNVRGVQADTSELNTFLVESFEPQPGVTAEARLAERDGAQTLDVTVTNGSAMTLENATLIAGETQVALGDLAAGDSRSITRPVPLPPSGPAATAINPIVADPSFLLGTSDYFADATVFPRWQLLQALAGSFEVALAELPQPDQTVTLAGWINETSLAIDAPGELLERTGDTLYFLEIPVRRDATP